jgi:p-hydroxybenzoate 3-monooxygenase
MSAVKTQVGIVGAGPAGLVLSQLLHRAGIESVILENRDREYVTQRVRAGLLEQGTVDLLDELGLADRLHREGLVHQGLYLRFRHQSHRIPLSELTDGKSIYIYGQQEVVKDLIEARLATEEPLYFEVSDVSVHDFESDSPLIKYTHEGEQHELQCDVIAGCDGFHGICRPAIESQLTIFNHEYPFGWLGILATVPPSTDELIYTLHERGFALHTMRSPELSRLYLQCDPRDDIAEWSDERIWDEMHKRFQTDDGWELHEGPIIDKGITPMRSFVAQPMQHGRLYLAGDAAHIVPPTGAKGLNLAVRDVRVLAEALTKLYGDGDSSQLDAYSDTCLRRVWRVQHFSWWMTSMLHLIGSADNFEHELQLAELDYVVSSKAAATTLAENYVGLDKV